MPAQLSWLDLLDASATTLCFSSQFKYKKVSSLAFLTDCSEIRHEDTSISIGHRIRRSWTVLSSNFAMEFAGITTVPCERP